MAPAMKQCTPRTTHEEFRLMFIAAVQYISYERSGANGTLLGRARSFASLFLRFSQSLPMIRVLNLISEATTTEPIPVS